MNCTHLHPFETLNYFFKRVGNPTPHTTDRLKSLQRRCEQIGNPHVFYLTLNVRPYPTISWCGNTEKMLGGKRISYDDYLSRIHPEWTAIYSSFLVNFYRLISTDFYTEAQYGWSFYLKIPLRSANGTYAWYTQFTKPMEFDHRGEMVSTLSTYTYVEAYENYRPTGPMIVLGTERNYKIQRQLQQITDQFITHQFLGHLRPYEQKALRVIRRQYAETKGGKLDLGKIGQELSVSRQAVYKYSYRIMEVTRDCFPVTGIKVIEDLARLLNALFGKPPLS